ncbi:MAG: hypothetical protein ACXVXP_09490 [Mycobacteriaceae bacterium]
MSAPTLTLISLGAGVQSTALYLLALEGKLGHVDGAIFADTGWEPPAIYEHLNRLIDLSHADGGIPIYVVGVGNIRDDALDPAHRFASMPLFVKNKDGGDGMARRQCTSEYKLRPVKEQTRRLLGATNKPNGRPGRVPTGRWAQTLIGFSTDEADRATRIQDVGYSRSRFPLLDMGWSRADCRRYLTRKGFGDTQKSSCIGCPYRTNKSWRRMRDEAPADFADAVDFDAAMRHRSARANAQGQPLRGEMFLHRSRLPLDQAPIDRINAREWAERQGDILELALQMADEREDAEEAPGCSPWGCHA